MNFIITDVQTIEKLIAISKSKPLMPETYIPWSYKDNGTETYLPEHLISLAGLSKKSKGK